MSNNSAIGSDWADVRKELFTEEEIRESNLRVALIGETINAKQEKGISQNETERRVIEIARKKTRSPPMVRYFRCTACGEVNPATKSRGYTGPGHVKTFYCPKCKRETDQVQVDTK